MLSVTRALVLSFAVLSPVLTSCPAGSHYDETAEHCDDQPHPRQSGLTTFAVLTQERLDFRDPLLYDVIQINRGNHLTDRYLVTVPETGTYLITLSAGAGGFTEVDFRLHRSGSPVLSILRNSFSHPSHDTLSRDVILTLNANDQISTSTVGARLYSEPTGLQTSWGMMSLSGQLGIRTSFSVGITYAFPAGIIQYPLVLNNDGGGWDSQNNRYVAPVNGVYYFTYSLGVDAGVPVRACMRVNAVEDSCISRNDTSHNGEDTLSRSVIIELNAGQTVQVASDFNGYSDFLMQTSLSGFLYSPAHAETVAWGAYRTEEWEDTGLGLTPITYDLINVDTAGIILENRVVCAVGGLYYVHITAGAIAGWPVEVRLLKEGTPVAKLSRAGMTHTGIDTLSRSLIVQCNFGEVMWLEASAGTALYSSRAQETGFAGFLLFPQ